MYEFTYKYFGFTILDTLSLYVGYYEHGLDSEVYDQVMASFRN